MESRAGRRAAVVAVAVCALAVPGLTACTSGSGAASSPPGSSSSSSSSSASPTAPAAATSPAGASSSAAPSRSLAPPPRATDKPSVAVSTAPPVKVGATATLKPDVLIVLGTPRAVTVTANGPGEIAGDAVAVPVTVKNTGRSAFDLGGLAVNASYGSGQGTPASPSDASPSKPLQGSLAAGGSASGTYVFTAPRSAVARLRVEISSSSSARIVVFRS